MESVIRQGIEAYRVQGPNARGPYQRFDDADLYWYQGVVNKGRYPDWPDRKIVDFTVKQLQGKAKHERH